MSNDANFLPAVDKIAVSASILCAVHCLCLPILVVVSPTIAATFLGQESFHQFLIWLILPISAAGLFMGCRKHQQKSVIFLGYGGLLILGVAASLGHGIFGESVERSLTLIGSFLVSCSHVRNYILCRNTNKS